MSQTGTSGLPAQIGRYGRVRYRHMRGSPPPSFAGLPSQAQEGVLVERIRVSGLSMWLLYTGALLAAIAAIVAWYLPVNSFDSSCSLATRNRYDNDDACADAYRTQWFLFVSFVLAAVMLAVGGVVVARRLPTESRRGSAHGP